MTEGCSVRESFFITDAHLGNTNTLDALKNFRKT